MASVEQLTIEFSGKGAGTLTTQLNTLSKAMNRLARRQIEQTKMYIKIRLDRSSTIDECIQAYNAQE